MSSEPSAAAQASPVAGRVVNDFSLKVATVNGSGSQTANNTILRSLFQMGIPCSGKNIFPSNIAGLPTWFTIRTSPRGYLCRRKEVDFAICMNASTAREDVREVRPGGAVVYEETLALDGLRSDVAFYPVPFNRLVIDCCPNARLRKLVVNMIYVGVAAKLLDIDRAEIDAALSRAFSTKPKALELNRGAVEAGWKYAEEKLVKRDPFVVERMACTEGKILVDGNNAAALGCVMAGVTVVAWYPITPSSSLAESCIDYLDRFRVDKETGKASFAVVQAEDEIAAIGMCIGAGWAGARTMTATSGPGISLMTEFVGLAYYAEVPCVIFDVQRTGPSTGLPTRTMQGDVLITATLGHGDTKHICLYPGSVSEIYEMAQQAFDVAERFQAPVFVMSDLDLGMNVWMSDPFNYPEHPIARGKVLGEKELRDLGPGKFKRYADVDGDGIPYRTLPGTPGGLGAYFTRGTGHSDTAGYTESGEWYVKNMDRLVRKYETARRELPAPEMFPGSGAKDFGILAYGTTHWAMVEALDQLREERKIHPDYCRVKAYPFHLDVHEFLTSHERIYVVEQNRDGQMAALLRMEYPDLAPRLRSVLHYDGMPIDARTISDTVFAMEDGAAARSRAASSGSPEVSR
jgi:2-oxoglutarate ferredoxin oxidoreductase subunit alpha